MLAIYSLAISLVAAILRLYGRLTSSSSKLALFAKGQVGLIADVERSMKEGEKHGLVIWFHASSLGEYAVIRPLVKNLRQRYDCTIVLTFFSSTGYLALKDRKDEFDYLFYLPLDTHSSARRFLNAVKPDRVVWAISEYWCNYFREIHRRKIPAFLVSAKIRPTSVFFRWYGRMFRQAISVFTHFFVLDEPSRLRLASIGYQNVTVEGNPLFDNAAAVAESDWSDAVLESFSGGQAFVAGSVSDATDEHLICTLANRHPDTRFIIVPHEPRQSTVERICRGIKGISLLYSKCNDATDMTKAHVLVVDKLGVLAFIYRYAKWAYVGGGFTRYLHSLIETTVYGLPVSFGPNIQRKITPAELIKLGIGQCVTTTDELDKWFCELKSDNQRLDAIRHIALDYVSHNIGSADVITCTVVAGKYPPRA